MPAIPTSRIGREARSMADIMAGKPTSDPKRKAATIKKVNRKKLATGSPWTVLIPPMVNQVIKPQTNLFFTFLITIFSPGFSSIQASSARTYAN